MIFSGFAILPIFLTTRCLSALANSSSGITPSFNDTKAAMACPLIE
jgi:hypothetical protein